MEKRGVIENEVKYVCMTYSCKLENLGSQVFEYGCDIDGSLGTNAHLVLSVLL